MRHAHLSLLRSILVLCSYRRRLFCSSSSSSLSRKLKNVPPYHRARALLQAQQTLTEYLHATRSLPFSHAELIATNSPSSLFSLLSHLPSSSPSDFPRALRRFLSFRPINEFDFFFESIGLSPSSRSSADCHCPHGHGGLFLSDDARLIAAVSSLVSFGFPWTKLGLLYREESSIFAETSDELAARLRGFESLGLARVVVIGICLAFPWVLAKNAESSETGLLFRDLKRVFSDFDLAGSAAENVEDYFRFCRRIRVFYDLGCEKGTLGDLLAMNRKVLLEFEEEDLIKKVDFFCRLDMRKEEVGLLVLRRPEILGFDLESPTVRMPDYLKRVGLRKEDLGLISRKYPHSMGRNRLGNLPGVMRALDLNKWFISKIKNGSHHHLSTSYVSRASDDRAIDIDFRDELAKAQSSTKLHFVANRLEFLLRIGMGENKITVRAVRQIHGTRSQLQERFDSLLSIGIDYSMLCRMVSAVPKILNQNPDMLHEKVNHLRNELGCSLHYLNNFPAYLCFDLENRVKPRYRILTWLRQNGLLKKHYSPATVLATSEKKFIGYLAEIHPAAPKQWLEVFSSKYQIGRDQKT